MCTLRNRIDYLLLYVLFVKMSESGYQETISFRVLLTKNDRRLCLLSSHAESTGWNAEVKQQ